MNIVKLSAAAIAVGMAVAPFSTPASAASPLTNVFLNNAVPNVDFLDRSSRFALSNSSNAKIKTFAMEEAREQTLAANAMDEWISADKRPVVAAASVEAPLLSGRSVAVDGQPSQLADNRLPMGQEDLDSLEGLNGADFDSAYKLKQAIALRQLATDYADYIAKGDDPVLLGIANRELPKVQRRLAAIGKI